jgi:hypothetical protein
VAGHTAGKSTFCRFVRHVLGERGFAPDSVKRRIRAKFPTGWIVAEVIVDDATWIIARPLGIGPRSFCLREAALDDVATTSDRRDYQEFLDAVAAATTNRLEAARFPANDEQICWEHVLPWLARDQECRFADFLEWRHSSSGSDAPGMTVDERQFVVRSVLGLISDAERGEQQRNARLVAEKKAATASEPLLRHQAETERAHLSRALGKELPPLSTPLFGPDARAEFARRRQDVEAKEKTLVEADRRGELRAALEDANQVKGALGKSLEDARVRLALIQESVAIVSGQQQASLLVSSLLPSRDFCDVPLRLAHERGCPLALDRPIDLTARRSELRAADDLAAERERAASLEEETGKIEASLQSADARTRTARSAYMSASTAYDEARSQLERERATLWRLEQITDFAETAAHEAAEKAEAIVMLSREIAESYVRQDQLREAQNAVLGRFSARFDYIVRAILGDEFTGQVDMSGRSLALTAWEHGERDSAAIATVKLLAFDLAAVMTSVEGEGAFPRFLIHDGPREADMAPELYERLFLFAHELEKCFQGEPAFQYILTTTTQPPDKFVREPWLCLQLAGMPAEARFLRCDL